jgi:hypothetical protein
MNTRRRIGFVTAILIGLAIGLLIKKVKIGLLIGIALGLFSGLIISSNKKNEE